MINKIDESLSANELVHLALEASARERYDLAISFLKQAMNTPSYDNNGNVAFLLGAQYAQIQMYDDAKHWMGEAIQASPRMEIAIFQLGLLQLLCGDDEASTTWNQLSFLPPDHALICFKDALLALNRNDIASAKAGLTLGLSKSYANAPLFDEMRKILQNLEAMPDAPSLPASGETDDGSHVLLSAYTH